MKKNKINKKGYSIIVIIVIIGFMVMLTSGVFRLIMNELKDNRTLGNYIKTYAGAESGQELALLDIKENGYSSDIVVSKEKLLNPGATTMASDIFLSYSDDGKVKKYEGILQPGQYHTIPLFYLDSTNSYREEKITDFQINNNNSNISWNIIGKKDGISGDGSDFREGSYKTIALGQFDLRKEKVRDFLRHSDQNYLQLYNTGTDDFEYEISSSSYFTKPEIKIISTGELPDYRTNLETSINLSDMISRSKYSIFSP